MANTVIAVRSSSATGNQPSLGVIANGELSLNFADGIIYYKTASNTLGQIRTTQVSGSNQQVQFNDSGSFGSSSGLTYDKSTGTLNAQYIVSTNSQGDEGGEILLAKAVTNTTLNGTGVTIDVYQNKLRFFEQGGSARGAYIDLTAASAGVGTNLLSGGGGGGSVTSVGGQTGAISNNQILSFVQAVSSTNNITFDYVATSNNGYGQNFKVGDDAWIGDYNVANSIKIKGQQDATNGYIAFGNSTLQLGQAGNGALTFGGSTVWHSGNDGAGSGLDADLLDGLNSTSFANATFVNTVANTDYTTISATSGVYGNASYIPVTTLTANGRVSSITNTAISIPSTAVTGLSTSATTDTTNAANITSGTLNSSQLPTTGTAGTYGNSTYIPVITTDAYGRISSVTNTAMTGTQLWSSNSQIYQATANGAQTSFNLGFSPNTSTNVIVTANGVVQYDYTVTGSTLTFNFTPANNSLIRVQSFGYIQSTIITVPSFSSNGNLVVSSGSSLVALPNVGSAGSYGSASYIPVITTDAYGRISSVTNTAIALNSSQLPTIGTAGTYGNAAYVPVVTTDTYGRVTTVTNTAISIPSTAVTGTFGFSSGGTNATSYTTGTLLTSNGTAIVSLANTGTAGTYANAAYVPVITTDAYGRVSGITNTAISIPTTAVTGTFGFSSGGTNATSYTTGALLTSNGTAIVSLANTGTAGTYANAAYVPVITTDAYGRISSITNTAIAIAASQITSGTLAIARGGTNQTTFTNGIIAYNGTALATLANTGTAGTYANAAYVPVITTDAYGRVSAVTNTAISITASQHTGVHGFSLGGTNASSYTTGTLLVSNGTAIVSLANTGTAGTYANAAYVPVITTDAYGRISSITNTAISIPSTAVTGTFGFSSGGTNATSYTTGTLLVSNGTAIVSLANTGTAGTYANAAYVPVITTDAYGRVSAVTNTAISISANVITTGTINSDLTVTGNIKLQKITEFVNSITASTANTTLDLSLGGVQKLTISANTTLIFSNVTTTGTEQSFKLYANTGAGSNTITWPTSVKWQGGQAPTQTTTANKTDIYSFSTNDAGSNWFGFVAGLNF